MKTQEFFQDLVEEGFSISENLLVTPDLLSGCLVTILRRTYD